MDIKFDKTPVHGEETKKARLKNMKLMRHFRVSVCFRFEVSFSAQLLKVK